MQLQSTMASLPLIYNYTAVFEAIDPSSGAAVTGVTVTNPSVYGIDLTAESGTGAAVPLLPSLFVPVDVSP